MNWFGRRRPRVVAPRIRSRSATTDSTTKVDLAELTPELSVFLGKAAYLELTLFENLSRAIANAPTTQAKAGLSRAAAASLEKHRGLAAEIERAGGSVAEVMEPARAAIDRFQRVTQGADWYETLVTCYVTSGFLDDFLVRVAAGLPRDAALRVRTILATETGELDLARELAAAIQANPRLASRLALWGRRLVGDTMLIARSVLTASANHLSDEARIEPVFTELIAAHTRRMDALGLTA